MLKKVLISILSISFIMMSFFVLPVSAKEEGEETPYGIVSGTYRSNWIEHKRLNGSSDINSSTWIEVTYRVVISYKYNPATGLLYGTPQKPQITIIDATSVTEDLWIDSVSYNVTQSADGYSYTYSNISFVAKGIASWDESSSIVTYQRCYYPYSIVIRAQ